MEELDIINEQNKVIGQADKRTIYEKKLLHRIVHVLVFNTAGQLALQRQSQYKSFCPLHWSTTVGGHVRAGETPYEAAIRETSEEIGIRLPALTLLSEDLYQPPSHLSKMLITFRCEYNGPFSPNLHEVAEVRFFSLDEIKVMLNRDEKFHPELRFLLKHHFNIFS